MITTVCYNQYYFLVNLVLSSECLVLSAENSGLNSLLLMGSLVFSLWSKSIGVGDNTTPDMMLFLYSRRAMKVVLLYS